MNSLSFRMQNFYLIKALMTGCSITLLITLIAVLVQPTFATVPAEKNLHPIDKVAKAVLHNSVAVLPFENLSPNPDDAYFSAGVHQEIVNQLGKIQDMSVIFYSSLLHYKDTNKSIPEIASELNVGSIMTGSVRYVEDRFNLAVQLIEPSNSNLLWAKKYERDLSDIFEVQADIIKNITTIIGAKFSTSEQERIDKPLTDSLEAYKFYLKAMLLASNAGPVKPPEYYQNLDKAIALDTNFAFAHAIKADEYGLAKLALVPIGKAHGGPQSDAGNGLTFNDMENIALEHADIALALDPTQALAYKARTSIYRSHRRGSEAWETFEKAVQLDPTIMHDSTHYLQLLGKNDDAIGAAQRVLELAPNNANNHANLGWMLTNVGRAAEAAQQYRLAISLNPDPDMHLWLGMNEILLKNNTEALKQLRLVEKKQSAGGRPPDLLVAYGYSRLGMNEDAMRIVTEHEMREAKGQLMRSGAKALAYLTVGKVDEAFDILSQNPTEGLRYIQVIKSNIMNDPVLEEPRFVEVRRSIGI